MSISEVKFHGFTQQILSSGDDESVKKTKRLTPTQQKHSEDVIKSKKRKADDSSEDVSTNKRFKLLNGDRKQREREPVIELTRDEIIQYGTQVKSAREVMHVLEHLAKAGIAVEEIAPPADEMEVDEEISSDDPRLQDLREIADERSGFVGSIMSVVYEICEKNESQYPRGAKLLMKFAFELASTLPKKHDANIESDNEEISPENLAEARKIASIIGMDVDEDKILSTAKKIQKDSAALQESQEDENFTINEQENQVARVLGSLLFLIENDIHSTIQLISRISQEESIHVIVNEARKIIAQTNATIKLHASNHKKCGLQEDQLAYFQKISIEMAKLLLLEHGFINVGLIDEVFDILIPNEMKNYEAVKSMRHFLNKLQREPDLWLAISEVEAPVTPELNSNELIRACLGMNVDQEITERDAKITVLSALLLPIRQANAGTCFATSLLIKLMHSDLSSCLNDMSEIIKNGMIDRRVDHIAKSFGFQTRTSKESLDNILTVNAEGKILRIEGRENTLEANEKNASKTYPILIQHCPGIVQACQALEINDVDQVVLSAVQQFNRPFTTYELLCAIAKITFDRRNAFKYVLRSTNIYTLEQLKEKAFYAFGAQTNHPLHRAWEQTATQMFDYFGSHFGFPNWTYHTLKSVLKKLSKPLDGKYKRIQKTLLMEMMLPMITRMQYRYNHHFEEEIRLFEDTRYGSENNSYYGYELWDSGLPADFKYSRKLARQLEAHSGYMKINQFTEFQPQTEWKLVDTDEKFQKFIVDVMKETMEFIKTQPNNPYTEEAWSQFSDQFTSLVMSRGFGRRMIEGVFGKDGTQRKRLKKNEYTMTSTPWKFKWGGDPDSVLKGYYSFKDLPAKQIEFSGSAKEVLAWTINYLKKQPAKIKKKYQEPFALIPACSPTHAFLLRPAEPTLIKAYLSDEETNTYITQHVEVPGLEISSLTAPVQMRAGLIQFIAKNMWVCACKEQHDFDKFQLTEASKQIFDALIEEMKLQYAHITVGEFRENLFKIVIQSRAQDENIGKRYPHWEQQFKTILKHKIKEYLPEISDDEEISEESMELIINVIRDREDHFMLSPEYAARFKAEAELLPRNLSIKDFRTELLNLAVALRNQEQGKKDKLWKKFLQPSLDSRLFKLLSEEQKEKMLSSAIISHDTNWCDEMHYIYFAFMMNPGSGKLELCRYNPDTKKITFSHQKAWFPKKKGMHWQLPDNYRAFSNENLFKHKEFLYY